MTTLEYLNRIQTQRTNNPKYKKDYYINAIPSYELTVEQMLILFEQQPSTKFLNIITRRQPLYTNTLDLSYYEYATTINDINKVENTLYFYIPISYKQYLIDKEKLPYLNKYNVHDTSLIKVYPDGEIIIRKTLPIEYRQEVRNNDFTKHPLCDNYSYLGLYYVLANGETVYVYYDENELHDSSEVIYLSKYKPLKDFDYDLISLYNFELDELIGGAPSEQYYPNDKDYLLPSLRFTGRVTTKEYNKYIKYYEYIESEGFAVRVLLPYPPTNKNIFYVFNRQYNLDNSIFLTNKDSRQRIGYTQRSTNKVIQLG